MTNAKIVVDANILIKLFYRERDTQIARDLIEYLIEEEVLILAPSLLITETLSVCFTKDVDIDAVLHFFEVQQNNMMFIVDLDTSIVQKACEIAQCGHPKSGYPSFNDSVYHAVALTQEATFITADDKHLKKTENFGSIYLLKDWQEVFSVAKQR